MTYDPEILNITWEIIVHTTHEIKLREHFAIENIACETDFQKSYLLVRTTYVQWIWNITCENSETSGVCCRKLYYTGDHSSAEKYQTWIISEAIKICILNMKLS